MPRGGDRIVLLGAVMLMVGAGCDKGGPEMNTEIVGNAKIEPVNQEYKYGCEGKDLEEGEEPKIDVALDVTEKPTSDGGKQIVFNVTAAEEHGWAVCTVNVEIWHNRLNKESGEWEREGLPIAVTIPRIDPGPNPTKFSTPMAAEFGEVEITEAGPPESWGCRVRDWQIVKKPPA